MTCCGECNAHSGSWTQEVSVLQCFCLDGSSFQERSFRKQDRLICLFSCKNSGNKLKFQPFSALFRLKLVLHGFFRKSTVGYRLKLDRKRKHEHCCPVRDSRACDLCKRDWRCVACACVLASKHHDLRQQAHLCHAMCVLGGGSV